MFYKVNLSNNNHKCEVSAVKANTKEDAIEKAKYRYARTTSNNMYDINEIEEIVKNTFAVSCNLQFK